MSTWFDEEGRRVERWASPGEVVLRLDADHLVPALRTVLEVEVEVEPPRVRLLAELDRSEAYALGQVVDHPGLSEDALLRADPNRPLTLEWVGSERLARTAVDALAEAPPGEVLTAPDDHGFPALFDLEHYTLAAVRRPA